MNSPEYNLKGNFMINIYFNRKKINIISIVTPDASVTYRVTPSYSCNTRLTAIVTTISGCYNRPQLSELPQRNACNTYKIPLQ